MKFLGKPQGHQDFIFNTARGIGGKADAFFAIIGKNRLNQPNDTDGNQFLRFSLGIVVFLRNMGDQTQIMQNQRLFGGFLFCICSVTQAKEKLLLLLFCKGLREGAAGRKTT